ncbi:uncharacterized protein LOC111683182 [Lucilia cuprina]|uniref:uncharacterized protein LOC111683182 n=1 Tax=Lucilia cuprina TaxID=7375 RepID=UPI001F063D9D|nr:uncharacterized protein LOC111683182 [Lucilia cuprina]
MNFLTVCKSFIIIILLLGVLSAPTESKKVIFFGKPSINLSQLLITQNRGKPCQKGFLLDHRNRCRRVLSFSRLTRG